MTLGGVAFKAGGSVATFAGMGEAATGAADWGLCDGTGPHPPTQASDPSAAPQRSDEAARRMNERLSDIMWSKAGDAVAVPSEGRS
ncbi:MAG TPA: hypothetical protein VFE13_05775 [Caulobacteraceae bacterium]|nr:hypothetical protein [Caulobacteraceae bacterium]